MKTTLTILIAIIGMILIISLIIIIRLGSQMFWIMLNEFYDERIKPYKMEDFKKLFRGVKGAYRIVLIIVVAIILIVLTWAIFY